MLRLDPLRSAARSAILEILLDLGTTKTLENVGISKNRLATSKNIPRSPQNSREKSIAPREAT